MMGRSEEAGRSTLIYALRLLNQRTELPRVVEVASPGNSLNLIYYLMHPYFNLTLLKKFH